jgi:tetratricopeptide (TPR) repeat protein
MAKRVAFLIGNQTFLSDSGLLPLRGPANDLTSLARLLRDPEHGRFEVSEFLDKPSHEILPEIEQALSETVQNDLLLIYYSGHGKLDRNGRLCLATANTRQSALLATSIPARHLCDLVELADCDQVVLLLDCCYSGAVGLRGDVESELRVVENASGFYIMTASSEMQAAREEQPAAGGAVMGRFTAALVSGVETGAADRERKGKVLLSDLRRHLEQAVVGQTPKFFARNANGDPLISLCPATAVSLLDAEVLADLDAALWHRRLGAVFVLAGMLREESTVIRSAAQVALLNKLRQERDYAVRAAIESSLGAGSVNAPDLSRSPFLPSPTTVPPEVEATTLLASAQHEQQAAPTKGADESAVANSGRIRGERADSLERAIAAYEAALTVFTSDTFPEDWARTQNNLGKAYSGRIRGDRADNLERAIVAYEAALTVFTPDAFLEDWAITQNNLGDAYRGRIRGEWDDNLERAIAAYEAALTVFTPDAFPEDWARTQNNLGNAYSDRIRGQRTDNLERAIAAYEAALTVFTSDTFPVDWARTQNNLANAYSRRRRGERADNLERAIAAYEAALTVFTSDAFPEAWADTQNNLGDAYRDRIQGKSEDGL